MAIRFITFDTTTERQVLGADTSITNGANLALSNLASVSINENLTCSPTITSPFTVNSPAITTAITSKSLLIKSGQANSGSGGTGTGNISLVTGDNFSAAGSSLSGQIELWTGISYNSTNGGSGPIKIHSGDSISSSGATGPIDIYSGTNQNSNSSSGNITLSSGSGNYASGSTNIGTGGAGNGFGTEGYSGDLNITTGSSSGTISSPTTGSILIKSGNVPSYGTSGNVTLQSGTGLTRGSIILNALAVNLTTTNGLDMGSKKITSLLDCTADQDAATKYYSDNGAKVLFDLTTSGSTKTVTWSNGSIQKVTMDANCTFTFASPVEGKIYRLKLLQDGTGSWTYTWPGSVIWPAASSPTASGANKVDIVEFLYDGTNYYGSYKLNY